MATRSYLDDPDHLSTSTEEEQRLLDPDPQHKHTGSNAIKPEAHRGDASAKVLVLICPVHCSRLTLFSTLSLCTIHIHYTLELYLTSDELLSRSWC
jgi:hypothetical protein